MLCLIFNLKPLWGCHFFFKCFLFGFLLLKTISGCRGNVLVAIGKGGPPGFFWVLAGFMRYPLPCLLSGAWWHKLLKSTATETRDPFSLALTQCHHLSPGHLSTSESQLHPPSSPALAGHPTAPHTHCFSCISAISSFPHREHIRASGPLSCRVHPEVIPNIDDKSGMGQDAVMRKPNHPSLPYMYMAFYRLQVHAPFNSKPSLSAYSVPDTVLRVWAPHLTTYTHQVSADMWKGRQVMLQLYQWISSRC